MIAQPQIKSLAETASMADLYKHVRSSTLEIVAPLEIEDYVIQTAEFMSPPRWHIGHTSWFFETVLQKYQPGYQTYSDEFLFYFNSYYEGFGPRIARPKRGTRSRPTVKETLRYRSHVDESMLRLLAHLENKSDAAAILALVRLGLEHEMQHQELLVYDIKHLLCDQFDAPMKAAPTASETVSGMVEIEGGLFELGYGSSVDGDRGSSPTPGPPAGQPGWGGAVREGSRNTGKDAGEPQARMPALLPFAFDNEKPQHKVWLENFSIDRALVSNGEYLEFINRGGYQNF